MVEQTLFCGQFREKPIHVSHVSCCTLNPPHFFIIMIFIFTFPFIRGQNRPLHPKFSFPSSDPLHQIYKLVDHWYFFILILLLTILLILLRCWSHHPGPQI